MKYAHKYHNSTILGNAKPNRGNPSNKNVPTKIGNTGSDQYGNGCRVK